MAFYQVPQGGGSGFVQLHDSNNPAAQAYARMALARNGIHVPPGQDAAAVWRQYSAQRASLRTQAAQQGPDPYEAGVNPNQPLGSPEMNAQPPEITPAVLGSRLPDGGFRQWFRQGSAISPPSVIDWRSRIAAMANHLSSANTEGRAQMTPVQFHANQAGPAEQVLQLRRVQAVNQAHEAARNLAGMLAARKPSRSFRRTHDPRAY